jgi:hypothetical protein
LTTRSLSPDNARELVQRFLMDPGQEVKQTRQVGHAFIVESDDWWQVEPIDRWPNFQKSDLYDLYEVRLYVFADPPPAPHGFGTPRASDESFHLNDANQFRAFFSALAGRPADVELAGLLTRYVTSEEVGLQALILSKDDVRDLLYPEHLETIAEKIRFNATQLPGDSLEMDFSSYYVMPADESQPHRIALNHWHVEVHAHKDLTWQVEPLAVGLPSPFYT